MAETEEEVQTEEKPKKAGMSTMTLIGVIGGVVALQAIIVFAVFKFFINSPDEKAEDKPKEKHAAVKHDNSDEDEGDLVIREVGGVIETDEMIINARNSKSNYLALQLGLEVEPADKAEELKEKLKIPVRDKAISIYSAYTVEELLRPGLRDSLKVELKKELKPYFGEVKLRNIYYSKYVLQ